MRQFSSPANGAVRAFHGFDGNDHTVFHHDALADVQGADLFAHVPAVADVFPFLRGRLASRQGARLDEDALEPERGLADLNAFLFDFLRHPAENVVILEMNQFGGQRQGAKVRPDRGKDMSFLDAAEHDGPLDAITLEGVDQLAELPDLDPVNAIDVPL